MSSQWSGGAETVLSNVAKETSLYAQELFVSRAKLRVSSCKQTSQWERTRRSPVEGFKACASEPDRCVSLLALTLGKRFNLFESQLVCL